MLLKLKTILSALLVLSTRVVARAQETQTGSQVSREHYDQLLATTHWALGTMAGVVVAALLAIVGLGWYTNFHRYRRDLETLEKRLLGVIDTRADKIGAQLQKQANTAARAAVRPALRDLQKIQYKMLLDEATSWEKQGVTANALSALARALPLGHEVLSELYVPDVLDTIRRLLQAADLRLATDTATDLRKGLEAVGESFAPAVEAIERDIQRAMHS